MTASGLSGSTTEWTNSMAGHEEHGTIYMRIEDWLQILEEGGNINIL